MQLSDTLNALKIKPRQWAYKSYERVFGNGNKVIVTEDERVTHVSLYGTDMKQLCSAKFFTPSDPMIAMLLRAIVNENE